MAILDERMFLKDPVIRTELDQYAVWYSLRKTMLMENRDYDQITTAERQTLENLALQYFYTAAGKKAVAMLDFHESGWFIPPAYGGDQPFTFRSAEIEPEENFEVKIYPNPGSVIVNFQIENNLNLEEELQLIIYDSSGKYIFSRVIKDYETFITLQTADWASGLYSFHIISNTETLKTDTFEIIR